MKKIARTIESCGTGVLRRMKGIGIAVALVACTTLSSCSSDSDNDEPQKPAASKTYHLSVNATKGSTSALTRALKPVESGLEATWALGEKVFVKGKLESDGTPFWFKGYLEPNAAGATTRLDGTISLPDDWKISVDKAIGDPNYLTLQFPRPDDEFIYSDQVGTLDDIARRYDYAVAENVRVDVVGDHLLQVETANFVSQQAIVKFTLVDKVDATQKLSPDALIVYVETATGDPVEQITLSSIPAATYTTNGDGVLFVAIPGFADMTVKLEATIGSNTYTFTKKKVTLVNGEYYEINVKMVKQ